MVLARLLGRRIPHLLGLLSVLVATSSALAEPKLLFVGDSITNAFGLAANGFPSEIAERFPELAVAVAACGGSTIRDWTTDAPSIHCAFRDAWRILAAPELPVQITHIMLGTNDSRGAFELNGPVPPAEFEQRLQLLVERSPGLVLVSPPPRSAHPSQRVDERLRAYGEVIRKVASDRWHVEIGVDTYALLRQETDFLDGVHPNTLGHAKIADALERRLLMLLPRGLLSPCKGEAACARFRFLPQFRHLFRPGVARGRRR